MRCIRCYNLGYNKSPKSHRLIIGQLNATMWPDFRFPFFGKSRGSTECSTDVLCKECRGLRRWHWRHYLRSANVYSVRQEMQNFQRKFREIKVSLDSTLVTLVSFVVEMLQRPLIIPPSQCSCFDSFFCLAMTRGQVTQMGQNSLSNDALKGMISYLRDCPEIHNCT